MYQSKHIWDVIVVGAGMAGAACVSQLAAAGVESLVLEAGPKSSPVPPRNISFVSKLARRLGIARPNIAEGRWPGHVEHHGRRGMIVTPAVLGTGPGGGSNVYGAALTRFRRSDFEEDYQPIEGRLDETSPLPNVWPVDYDEMVKWYEKAEAAMRVRGTADPLDPDIPSSPDLMGSPPASSRDVGIAQHLVEVGLHPFRLPVGLEYRPGCTECLGIPCPRGCKRNAWDTIVTDNSEKGSSTPTVKCNIHVQSVTRSSDDLFSVICEDAADGTTKVFRSRRVVFAAGALNTPRILRRSSTLWDSGMPPAMIGCGLMFHISDLFTVRLKNEVPSSGFRKTIGLRDYYAVNGIHMGEVQSMGIQPTPSMIAAYFRGELQRRGFGKLAWLSDFVRIPAVLLNRALARMTVLATVMEDLPYAENKVLPDGPDSSRIRLNYRISSELRTRARAMRALISKSFSQLYPHFITPLATPNFGHPMGTCRMGRDAASSVVDFNGQVWGQSGLYVCDAATFPSSGGTNPGLTVLANAMRIGGAIAAEASRLKAVNAAK